jgi:broad specificity phosphatase PhoE
MTENHVPDETTVVHHVRHVIYGRIPGYHLSENGVLMAKAVADFLAPRDVTALRCSPLDRAVETAAPIAQQFGLEAVTDDRLIEPWNHFEGIAFGVGDGSLRHPEHWFALRNPLRPSWGEPYKDVAARVMAAVRDAARDARGHEAVCVSHQLPIWVTRRAVEGRRLWHDPRRRECALGSVTSLTLVGDEVVNVSYTAPSGDRSRRRTGRGRAWRPV